MAQMPLWRGSGPGGPAGLETAMAATSAARGGQLAMPLAFIAV
jgi:hypothetical protein